MVLRYLRLPYQETPGRERSGATHVSAEFLLAVNTLEEPEVLSYDYGPLEIPAAHVVHAVGPASHI